jgi:hypothetical protein
MEMPANARFLEAQHQNDLLHQDWSRPDFRTIFKGRFGIG